MIKTATVRAASTMKVAIINITPEVAGAVEASGIREGVATVFLRHTSAGLTVQEDEPLLKQDFVNWLNDFIKDDPENPKLLHNCLWMRPDCEANEPRNADAHLKGMFIGNSCTIPVVAGELGLGRWQQVLLVEMDGPREREVTVMVQGNSVQEGLEQYWQERAHAIDRAMGPYLEERWESQVLGISRYITRGGKRLRGVLTLLICECLGGDMEKAMDAAIALEVVHAASLAKDDVQDGDRTRRKGMAAWVAYGLRRATGMADVMIPHAIHSLRRYGYEAVYVALDAWREMGTGQVKDLFLSSSKHPGVYEDTIRGKTVALFGLATTLGAMAAKADREHRDLAKSYGRRLGFCFQVIDDYQDMEQGKPIPLSFKEWLGDTPVAARVEDLIGGCQSLAGQFPEGRYREYLVELPRLALDLMLKEAREA